MAVLLLSLSALVQASQLGDIIATGLGMSPATLTSSASSTASSVGSLPPNTWSNASTYALSTGVYNTAFSTGISALTTGSSTGNGSNMTVDCWDQWNEFWILGGLGSTSYSLTSTLTTETSVGVTTLSVGYKTTRQDTTITEVWTLYADPNDLFPIGVTSDILIETANGLPETDYSATATSTFTTTFVDYDYSRATLLVGTLPTPQCSLPAIVPQCQSQWETALAAGGRYIPSCTQAVINSAQCSTLISEEYAGWPVFGNKGVHAWVTSGSSTFWPTTESFAPGCTLGCQQCAITGDTVQLYYWPPTTATAVENGTMTARPSRLPLTGSDAIVTAVVNNFTMTSPTIYISYAKLYASNSCSGIGSTYTNAVIPLPDARSLYSLSYTALKGGFEPGNWEQNSWEYITKPYNLSDLIEPIPASIYNQMPVCQSDLNEWKTAGLSKDFNFTCTVTASYAPIIALPMVITVLDSNWDSCTAWYNGALDPPIALSAAAVVAPITLPSAPKTTAASPSSSIEAGIPEQTATTQQQASETTQARQTDLPSASASSVAKQPQSKSEDTESDSGVVQSVSTQSVPSQSQDGNPPQSASRNAAQVPSAANSAGTNAAPAQSQSADPLSQSTSISAPQDPSAHQSGTSKSAPSAGLSSQIDPADPAPTSQPLNAVSVLAAALSSTIVEADDPAGTDGSSASLQTHSFSSVTDETTAIQATVHTESSEAPASVQLTAGGETFTAIQAAGTTDGISLIAAHSTVVLPQDGTTILNGQTIKAEPSGAGIEIGSQTVVMPSIQSSQIEAATAQITAGGEIITLVQPTATAGGVNIVNEAGSTISLAPDSTTVIGGETVAAAPLGGVVVGSQTIEFNAASTQVQATVQFTAGGQTFTALQPSPSATGFEIIVGGSTTTLRQDETTTIDGETIAAGPSGGIVVGSQTVTFATPIASMSFSSGFLFSYAGGITASFTLPSVITSAARESVATLVANGHTIPAVLSDGAVIMAGTTLTQGQVATISNQVLSVGTDVLVAGSSTISFAMLGPSITVGSSIITANSASQYLIGSQTLAVGGSAITDQGTTYSLASEGTAVVVDGSTLPITAATPTDAEADAVFTMGSAVVTAVAPAGTDTADVVIDGTTLVVGGPGATIGGQTVSEGSAGLVVGESSTIPLLWTTSTAVPGSSTAASAPELPSSSATPSSSSATEKRASSWEGKLVALMALLAWLMFV